MYSSSVLKETCTFTVPIIISCIYPHQDPRQDYLFLFRYGILSLTYSHSLSLTHTLSHTHSLSLTQTLSLTHSHSLTLTLTLSLTHSLSFSLTHSLSLTQSLSLTHTLSHTQRAPATTLDTRNPPPGDCLKPMPMPSTGAAAMLPMPRVTCTSVYVSILALHSNVYACVTAGIQVTPRTCPKVAPSRQYKMWRARAYARATEQMAASAPKTSTY